MRIVEAISHFTRTWIVPSLLVLSLCRCGDDTTADSGVARDATSVDARGDSSTPDAPGADTGEGRSCGDGTCDVGEACETCALDCGECIPPAMTECNDGIDNDGDGLVDWQYDLGCFGPGDEGEGSASREDESGWTTFDLQADSQVIYVSRDGDDANDGLSPGTAVATPARGAELVRDGFPDFLLFRRGDTWRASLGENRVARRFKSGRSADAPLVISTYGESLERPRFDVETPFLDDDGNGRRFVVVAGLAFISYRKDPLDPAFDGASGGAVRIVSGESQGFLMEDNYVEYGEFIVQNAADIELRRNVVYRSYHDNTCAYRPDGSRDPNGNREFRPSGIFAGSVDGLLLEDNVFDENGWNPDVEEACATIYNHNLYLSGCDGVVVRNNLILRASSIGIKMASADTGESREISIEGNVIAEGEIGISMGGNGDTDHRFARAALRNNVFTDIGRSQPTGRDLSWYIQLSDNDESEISGNHFLNQPPLGNGYGIRADGDSNRSVEITANVFSNMRRRLLVLQEAERWSAMEVTANTFVQTGDEACLLEHGSPGSAVTFADNRYRSAAADGEWFCRDGQREGLDAWTERTREAIASPGAFVDATRSLDTYAAFLGLGDSLADFASAARRQSRLSYQDRLSASQAAAYLRQGHSE